jgi:hypothetical protein
LSSNINCEQVTDLESSNAKVFFLRGRKLAEKTTFVLPFVYSFAGGALDLELVDNTAAGELSYNKWNQQNWFPTTIGMSQQSI